MNSAVIIFPGSNRDHDMIRALEAVFGKAPHRVWHQDTDLPKVDLIALPGGFSYGDYLRAGAIAARAPIMRAVAERAAAGAPILGVCNGFQILCEAGLLPGILMHNASQRFICRQAWLRVETTASAFTAAFARDQIIGCPVAHGEGNYRCGDDTLARLTGEDRVVFRYAGADGTVDPSTNPNGSVDNIAGILNHNRNVLGMMPHPENLVESLHGGTDGRGIFQSVAGSMLEVAS